MSLLKKRHIILLLFAVMALCNAAANSDKLFRFSNSHINSIYQDSYGYIWVCSDYGLNRFDGSTVKTFYHSQDSTSLASNSVLTLLEDKTGEIWVGTIDGIQRFDRNTEQFRNVRLSYPHITDFTYVNSIIEDSKGNLWFTTSRSGVICLKAGTREPIYYLKTNSNICSNKINTLFEDSFGNIWIGSQDNGISVMNTENHTITNHSFDPADPESISSNNVFTFSQTPDGTILVGTIDGGIDAYDFSTHTFTRNYIPCDGNVFTMHNDKRGRLWIGTDGDGLKCYDFKTKQLSTYKSDLQEFNFNRIKVHSIYEDRQGNLWTAVYQKGVMMIPREGKQFFNIGFNPFVPQNSIGSECVLSIIEDRTGDIWIGTDGDGIYRLDKNRAVKCHYSGDKIRANAILSLFEDSDGNIYAGSYLYGLFRYIPQSDSFTPVGLRNPATGEVVKEVNVINEDREGNLWIGTNGNGLCVYNPSTGATSFHRYNLMRSSGQILSNSVHAIFFDGSGNAWIGTSDAGLSRYNLKSGKFTDYNVANGRLCDNSVFSIAQDKQGSIWVGTKSGLNKIPANGGKPEIYRASDGLPNEAVYGIEIGNDGNLWISTSMGMSYFDTSSRKFTNYFTSDGIIGNEFKRGAHFKSQSGEIFFGGTDGVTSFKPFKSDKPRPLLNLAFTELYVYNKPVAISHGGEGILHAPLNMSEKIELPDGVNNFSIGYAALEYNNPNKVVYEVKLDGLDNDWIVQPTQARAATYTNLKPGEYTFRLRASVAGGPVSERSLKIIVEPPLWMTWWAKTIYAIIAIGLAWFAFRYVKMKMRARKENMEKANEKRIMESKIQFFTDISHEVRTPLTLILSPIEQLISKTDDPALLKTYNLIDQNGKRILRLINQIMELRKLDNSETKLHAAQTGVAEFLETIYSSFSQMADEKHIRYTLDVADGIGKVWLDKDKIDKVVFNVLSNAFKYTPDNGEIAVTAAVEAGNLAIRVKDSGTGIPEQYRQAIFDRFYQVPTESNRTKLGTGIGLHLSHKLMELHHGSIKVEESSEKGTTFLITLPLDPSYLKPEEMDKEDSPISLATLNQPSVAEVAEPEIGAKVKGGGKTLSHTLLLVEDDPSILNYLTEILSPEYNILRAANGVEGLETAISELPDCVITDIMMPEMDGTEMCKRIKANPATCDIPVIILTAKTSIEQRVEGIAGGADSYIPKPFNIEHLRTRVSKLIELRKAMRDKYSGKLEVNDGTVKVKSADDKLLVKVEELVSTQLANPELTVELIAQEIGVSRSHLHRKLKQLTNQNPSDYIKNTRLRHAAYLLSNKNIAVSEACYATGFSSLSHFSNSFKEYFGISPTKYVEINRKKPDNHNNTAE